MQQKNGDRFTEKMIEIDRRGHVDSSDRTLADMLATQGCHWCLNVVERYR
jgi:hypothetical protein